MTTICRAYYNEIDPFAAQWLRNLIGAGHIALGDVDTRSIEDVTPHDLAPYTQCHFFAGLGGWSHALRLAGWADDAPVWTGSCPCQPFSLAGKGAGFADKRHLWPHFHRLIRECRPGVIFGEQVASTAGLDWLDLVHTDLEAADYACAAVDLCAAGVGAPHIRQRIYWLAHADVQRRDGDPAARDPRCEKARRTIPTGHRGAQRLANTHGGDASAEREQCGREYGQQQAHHGASRLAHANGISGGQGSKNIRGWDQGSDAESWSGSRCGGNPLRVVHTDESGLEVGGCQRSDDGEQLQAAQRPGGATGGFWDNAQWLACTDAKARPTQPGLFPLANGATGRMGRIRAYGNAIVPQVAAQIIGAYMSKT